MIVETGVVVKIDDSVPPYIWVETAIKTTCSSCQAQANCGTSVVAKAFNPKTQMLKLVCDQPVDVGQEVKIAIAEEQLLRASLLVYLLPILGLIVGATLASLVMPWFALTSEIWVVLSGFCTAALVMTGVKTYLNGQNTQGFCPQLLEVKSPAPQQIIELKQL